MVFSSKVFVFAFLPITMLLYFVSPKKVKNYTLLTLSLLFYGFGEPKYVIVMVFSIFANYLLAMLIGKADRPTTRRAYLVVCVLLNIGMLVLFKYLGFFVGIANRLLDTKLSIRTFALPIGISFYTFQTLSYVVDVYRREVAVQRNPFKLGMYVSLFPQLIAGPIVRYSDIAAEIDERSVSLDDMVYGIRRFIIGLSKKVLLADIFAVAADNVFKLKSNELTTPIAWIGILTYSFQIYFDFSGYSDMAIGLGRMLGFHFLENFNYPYISKSMTEFWRRWHISLSSWFRDYLYIPLGGNRHGNVYFNLIVVFFLTGLWHGASVSFVLWGLWNGFFLIIERLLNKRGFDLNKIPALFRHVFTLLIVVLGWVLFRADSVSYALSYVKAMFGFSAESFKPYNISYFLDARLINVFVFGIIASTDIVKKLLNLADLLPPLQSARHYLSLFVSFMLLLLCVLFIMNQGYSPFIYFRF
ncbi:MAG: MBOAT family protein [Clostridiaceae bacterium]|nr:MBOAT family protein [Clostridiaceae bacterium]